MQAPRPLLWLLLACLLSFPTAAATPGIFQGKVYRPAKAQAQPGWLYVEGRNGQLRRVEISRARVFYSRSVPLSHRGKEPSTVLTHGVEVQVTAEQDERGEWRASQVEILKVAAVQADRR